ncbi:hypothetical protein ACH5RR_034495 [Cinchona calisaya]|uniref:Disease resistance N-terminal domain-containing protein n=1 Tax=Cinchona calisaya TaxID=153742 RepID=A0ABD2YF09_9GENT
MDSVETEAPSTSIHHRCDHDDPDPMGPENPDLMNKEEDNIQTMKRILISFWSLYARFVSKWYSEHQELQVRLKHLDQAVIQENEDDMGSSAPTTARFFILKSLLNEMLEINALRTDACVSRSSLSPVYAGEMVSLMDSVLQNLNDTFIFLAENISCGTTILAVKEQVEEIKDRLILIRNFLWLIPNRSLINNQDCVRVFNIAGSIALPIPLFLYTVVCSISGVEEEFAWQLGDVFSFQLASIDNFMGEFMYEYLESLLVAAAPDNDDDDEDDDNDNPTIDEKALEFADYLIPKLKLMMLSYNVDAKDQFDNLIDELNFLRCNLMEDDERMVEYCSLKIPGLLRAVDGMKQKASDLFNDYSFSSRKSWQSSNFPSTTNGLEYVNFIINKLEQLLRSKANPLNALEHHMEKVYEQLVSMRKFLSDIAQHLGNWHMEFLLTRFKVAAYQAEYIIDSYVAGEGSIWGHKLGLFVVIKDVKILHKELKAAILTMTRACDTVIPTISSSAPSQASYHVKGVSKGEIHNKDFNYIWPELLEVRDMSLRIYYEDVAVQFFVLRGS